MNVRGMLMWLAAVWLAGCASTGTPSAPPTGASSAGAPRGIRPMPPEGAYDSRVVAVQTGKASWYSRGAHGRPTANGETYNHWDTTCAHRTWPLGTYVRVTRLDNGRAIILQVNDRGPYIRGRIVDLSRTAATELDMLTCGLARVRLERLKLRPEYAGVYAESLPYRRQRPVPVLVSRPAVEPVTEPVRRMVMRGERDARGG
jgi:rare lipoprotein A